MLDEFIDWHHDAIVARTKERVRTRPWPSVSAHEIDHGVPLFLRQLSEILQGQRSATSCDIGALASTATRHGAELLAAGFTVSQVVHDYGDICQAITEIALEQLAPITVDEFHTLNRCLDTAIAEAVTEHTRLIAQRRSEDEARRLGRTAHEIRDLLNGALLAFHALKRGSVPASGSTGAVLGRSLTDMLALIDRSISEVRLSAAQRRNERVTIATFLDDIAATGMLHAEYRGIRFTVAPVEPDLAIDADPQLLGSAVMNLLHNAFKNTHAGGAVVLRARPEGGWLIVEVEDQCGGLQDEGELFKAFGDRGGKDRSGLGLGLSIAREAVRAHGGDITVTNRPGHGCIFTVAVPMSGAGRQSPQLAADTP